MVYLCTEAFHFSMSDIQHAGLWMSARVDENNNIGGSILEVDATSICLRL